MSMILTHGKESATGTFVRDTQEAKFLSEHLPQIQPRLAQRISAPRLDHYIAM
jgi:hypothetical protein